MHETADNDGEQVLVEGNAVWGLHCAAMALRRKTAGPLSAAMKTGNAV